MEKNLFIFSFKKKAWPLAALLAAGMILSLEVLGLLMMRQVRRQCASGNLARMDTNFFCKNVQSYCLQDKPLSSVYRSADFQNLKDAGKQGPYDVVVTGTSVGDTGWAEMMRENGWRILNMTANTRFRGFLPDGVIRFLKHSSEMNAAAGAVLLYTTLTDRGDLDFRMKSVPIEEKDFSSRGWESRFKNLWIYAAKKRDLQQNPEITFMPFVGGEEMFDSLSLTGISSELLYTEEDKRSLSEQLQSYRDRAAQKGFRFAFVAFPTKPQMYEWILYPERSQKQRPNLEALKEVCQKNGVPFLDLEKELQQAVRQELERNGKLLWFHCDTHMNELGAAYTAKVIQAFVARHFGIAAMSSNSESRQ